MKKLLLSLAMLLTLGASAWADLTPTVIVNENFDDGTTTLFTAQKDAGGATRITVSNDNNVKFATASNSANGYSRATYTFDTTGADSVTIAFAYWIANSNCSYSTAFVVRDNSVAVPFAKGSMGSAGAFFAVGKSRQSSKNYFSINNGKTLSAADTNLGLWCQAEINISVKNKKVSYKISKLEDGTVIKEESNIAYFSSDASTVSALDFYACVNSETDYLDNLVITKYVDQSKTLYSATFTESNGLVPSVKIYSDEDMTESVTNGTLEDGTTYYYKATLEGYEDYTGSFTVNGAAPSVGFTMTAKPTYTVTVNAIDGSDNVIKALTTIEGVYDGKSISYYYPKYLTDNNGNVTYSRDDFGKATVDASSATENVKYTAYEGYAIYAEGEDKISSTDFTTDNCSMGHGVRSISSKEYTVLTVNETGLYDITYAVCSYNVNNQTDVFVYRNSTEIDSLNAQFSLNYIKTTGTRTVSGVKLVAGDVIKFKGGSTNLVLDYALAVKTGDYTVTKTLGESGFGTFSATCNVAVPEGVKVYSTTFAGNTLTATSVDDATVIPANTGVIYKGTANTEYTFKATSEAGSAITTALTAAPDGVTGDGSSIYGLLKASTTFAPLENAAVLANNSAYLKVTSGAKAINFVIDEPLPTEVKTVEAADAAVATKKFFQNGQILIQTVKGTFTAAGAQVK